MKYEKYKLFWKTNGSKKEIKLIKWNEDEKEYYSFIKEQIENGYHLISVTSGMMLGFITEISSAEAINISKIELMEEDSEECDELNEMVDECCNNKGMLVKIINKLRYLEDESSIEIKRIYFTEQLNESDYGSLFIQVNGLIGVAGKELQSVNKLLGYVREIINV